MRGTGRAAFTAFLLLFVGTLNIFYGIGALGNAHVYVGETRLVFSNLHTYGWVLIILGVIQLTGGLSLFAGNAYGRCDRNHRREPRRALQPGVNRRQ